MVRVTWNFMNIRTLKNYTIIEKLKIILFFKEKNWSSQAVGEIQKCRQLGAENAEQGQARGRSWSEADRAALQEVRARHDGDGGRGPLGGERVRSILSWPGRLHIFSLERWLVCSAVHSLGSSGWMSAGGRRKTHFYLGLSCARHHTKYLLELNITAFDFMQSDETTF